MWRLHCSIRQLVVFSAKLAHNSNKPLRLRTLLIEISMGFEIHCAHWHRGAAMFDRKFMEFSYSVYFYHLSRLRARAVECENGMNANFSLLCDRVANTKFNTFSFCCCGCCWFIHCSLPWWSSHTRKRLRSPRTTKKNPFLQIFFLCIQISVSLSFHLFLHW